MAALMMSVKGTSYQVCKSEKGILPTFETWF